MTERDKRQRIWNAPNVLTMLRLALIPVFIWQYVAGHMVAALVIFLAASLTDFLDGYLARKYDLVTDFGKLMDPLADKLMQITALVCLCAGGLVPLWVLIVVIAKEGLMVLGGLLILKSGLVVQAQLVGKVATVVFMVAIAVTFLHEWVAPVDAWLQYLAVALSVISMIWYAVSTAKEYRSKRGPGG